MKLSELHNHVVRVRFHGTLVPAYMDEENIVRVWDDVAKHFTTCHNLSPAQIRRVKSAAK